MACGLARIYQSELRAWLSNPSYVLKLMTFNGSDGVVSHSLTTVSGARWHVPSPSMAPDGKLWFSAISGASFVDPRHLPFNNLPPPVHIEEIIADRASPGACRRLPAISKSTTPLSASSPRRRTGSNTSLKATIANGWTPAIAARRFIVALGLRATGSASSPPTTAASGTKLATRWISPSHLRITRPRGSPRSALSFLASIWGLYRLRIYQIQREFDAQSEGRVDERLRVARELHDTLLQSFHGLLPRFQAVYNLLPGRVADAKQVLETALDDAGKAITEARDAVQGMRSSTVVTNDLAKAVQTFGEELAAHQAATYGNAASFSAEMEGAPQSLHPILR